MHRLPSIAAVLFLAALTARAQAEPRSEQRARFEEGQRIQRDFELAQFARAGFPPLQEVTAAKREVRRVLFTDPYMGLPVPGVEIERWPNGRVTLRVIGSVVGDPYPVPADAWTELIAKDADVFRAAAYRPWKPRAPKEPPPQPPPICHGWIMRFAATGKEGERTATWAACGPPDEARLSYGLKVAQLALATQPECTLDGDPFWSFSRCFTTPPQAKRNGQ